jgi:cytochrome P450
LSAYSDLGSYLRKLILYHQSNIDINSLDQGNASLIESIAQGDRSPEKTRQFLTVDEILGNAFVFAVAGHETTAVSLEYALILLALYPEKQAWFHQQLDLALSGLPGNPREWDYHELFPKLLGPYCVMVCLSRGGRGFWIR